MDTQKFNNHLLIFFIEKEKSITKLNDMSL